MVNETIKNEVFAQLGIPPTDTKLLGGYNGNVFEVGRNVKFVVKILERSVNPVNSQISELEWLAYLHSHGVSVVRPLRVKGNEYIQQINNETYFVAYEKINGSPVKPNDMKIWGTAFFERWGEMVGKMHSVSKSYSPNNEHLQWFQNTVLLNIESIPLNPQLIQMWNTYKKEFYKLPISIENFGLIHGDLHYGNLLITGNEITVIDFGDCEQHWFAYDVAIVIYHIALTVSKQEREKFVKSFFSSFVNGYVRENSDTSFFSNIDFFINYRQLYSFTYHSLYADKNLITEQQLLHLKDMEASIVNERPFLDFSVL
ncbi:Phosphotransferase enzyme family protein [Paenibacillus sp. 1_12]|uniref:phosphotransferase enzyme family protein n=1 Tax=Paenibacillus sp. 1_12 TaxID=1566278 RepID=UPI0008E1B507|nr:phosphotransferase [Paenibacillus sp. 1_12]SFM28302.1 Phosphotransferase enzyme family protein [Paenibacillus sp. 1_12]